MAYQHEFGERVLPRAETLNNVTIESRGGAKLIIPDPDVIERISQETGGRVRYFAIPDRDGFEQDEGARHMGEPEFARYITRPLAEELTRTFPDKRLALRGVTVSINGHMPPSAQGDLDLWDITETAAAGVEKSGARFNVAGLDPDGSVHYRVNQYACGAGFMRAVEMETAEKAAATFPAIIVYDADGLQPEEGDYAVSFRDGVDPPDVLLAAYVLDCPQI